MQTDVLNEGPNQVREPDKKLQFDGVRGVLHSVFAGIKGILRGVVLGSLAALRSSQRVRVAAVASVRHRRVIVFMASMGWLRTLDHPSSACPAVRAFDPGLGLGQSAGSWS